MRKKQENESTEAWLTEVFPNDLGDNNHRWTWLVDAGTRSKRNILFVHLCNGEPAVNWIDITSGTKHQLVQEKPLTVVASIACPVCGDHGYITDGKWVPV